MLEQIILNLDRYMCADWGTLYWSEFHLIRISPYGDAQMDELRQSVSKTTWALLWGDANKKDEHGEFM